MDWAHHTFGGGITCCDHHRINAGISENSYWKEMTERPVDDNENLTMSTVRFHIIQIGLQLLERISRAIINQDYYL